LRNHATSDRQALSQELFSAIQQSKNVSAKLSVVEELGFVRPFELGYPKQALRELGLQSHRLPEQHDSGAKQLLVADQAEPPQQLHRFASSWF
jgi:hypothetical protein